MCKVDWVLVNGFIAATAGLVSAALLFWMIRVTIRYVNVTAGTLKELQRQQKAVLDREIRPYRSVLTRSIQKLETLQKQDLVSMFEKRDEAGWISLDDLLPWDFDNLLQQAVAFDVELYESLRQVKDELLSRPRAILFDMAKLGRSGRATLHPELPRLQAEFRETLNSSIFKLKSTRDNLEHSVAAVG